MGIELEEGEVICPKCKGEKIEGGGVYINISCRKCNGKGKVDWVSNAMDKPQNYFSIHDDHIYTASAIRSYVDTEWKLSDEIMKDLAEAVARKVDEEIIDKLTRSIMYEEEQNLKSWIVTKGEGIIDNGIIS